MLNPTFVHPTFISDRSDTYVVQLVVSDEQSSSQPDSVVLIVEPSPSVAFPHVRLTSPADGTVVAFSPITMTGVVSGPGIRSRSTVKQPWL